MKHTYHNERATSMVTLMPWADGIWLITHVWTHQAHRNKGQATSIMREVITEADRGHYSLVLSVDGDFDYTNDGLDNDQLEKWYTKFGFVTNREHVGVHSFMTRLQKEHESVIRRIFSP